MDKIKSDQQWLASMTREIGMRCWPGFDHGSFYYETEALADSCLAADTPHQGIAAILIYQQLVENLLWAIDYWTYYETALALFPKRLDYAPPERLMFGQLIERIERAQTFIHKATLLAACKALNRDCRIPAAHKLLNDGVFEDIPSLTRKAKGHCNVVHEHINQIQSEFWHRFEHFADATGIPNERNT